MGEEDIDPLAPVTDAPTIFDIHRALTFDRQRELREAQLANRDRNVFSKGFLRGIDQTQALVFGGAGLLRSALGDKAGAARSFEAAQEQFLQAEENPAEVFLFPEEGQRGATASFSDFGTFALETAGELLPSLASAVIGGVVGGAAGAAIIPGPDPADVVTVPGGAAGGFFAGLFARRALKELIEEAAEEFLKSGLKKEAAQRAAKEFVEANAKDLIPSAMKKIGARWGSRLGVGGVTAWLEGGGMWVEGVERGIDNPFSAMGLGLVSGASEIFLGVGPRIIKRVVGRAGGKALNQIARKEGAGAAADHLWDVARSMGTEAFQEFTQEFIATINLEINDPKFNITDKESFKRWVEAAAKGAVGGFVFGGGVAAVDSITQGIKNRQTRNTLANKESLNQWIESNSETALLLQQLGANPTNNDLARIGIPSMTDKARSQLVKDVAEIMGVPEGGQVTEVSDVINPVDLATGQELDTAAQLNQESEQPTPVFNRDEWPHPANLTEAQFLELSKLRRSVADLDPSARADLDKYGTEAWLTRSDRRGSLSAEQQELADRLRVEDPAAADKFIEDAITDPGSLPDLTPERTLADVSFVEFNARAEAAKLTKLRSPKMLETLLAVARQDSTADFSGTSARALADRGYIERVPEPADGPRPAGRIGQYAVTEQGWKTMGVPNPAVAASPDLTQTPATSETAEILDPAEATTGPAAAIPAEAAPAAPATTAAPEAGVAGSRPLDSTTEVIPEALFQQRQAELEEAFPGSTATPLEDGSGWTIRLANGKEILVQFEADIPVPVEPIMKFYGLTREEAEVAAARGFAGVTVPKGVKITLADGQVIQALDVMVFLDPRRSNERTAKNEAIHVFVELGGHLSGRGKQVWAALERKFGGKTQAETEENIAAAREVWEGPQGLWQHIRAFFNRLMTKIGATMGADEAMAETFNAEFWAQIENGVDPVSSEVRAQLAEEADQEVAPSESAVSGQEVETDPSDAPKDGELPSAELRFQLPEEPPTCRMLPLRSLSALRVRGG